METPGVPCPPSRDDHSFGTTITITTPPAEDHHSHPHQDGILSPTFYSQATTLVNSLSSPALPQKSNTSTVIHRHYWRVTSACLCFFAIGWGDGATGVVMPQMSKHFQLGYSMGSMLFVIISLGYALMNLVVEPTARILGRFYFDAAHPSPFLPRIFPRKRIVAYSPSKGRCLSLFLFGLFHCAYFLFAAWSPRYYGVLIAFFIGGMGKSVQIAQINGYWASNLRVHGVWFLHASYGFGAFASPLLGQTLRAHGFRWRSFFWISLSIALCNVFLGLYAFKTTDEEFTIERNLALASDALSQTTKKLGAMKDLQEDDYEKGLKPNKSSPSGSKSVWREVMCMPHFWTVAIFLLAYQGAETVAQGFIVTFALHERDANPNKVGYVASGFWAGLALGRIAWGVLSSSFSQRAKIYYMNIALSLAMIFHSGVWTINNIFVDAVLVSFVGLLTGPMIPMTLDVVTNSNGKDRFKNGHFLPNLHSEIQKTALTIMISAGAIGGAIFPLAAGLIASRHSVLMIEVLAFATVGFVFTFWLGAQIVSRVSVRA